MTRIIAIGIALGIAGGLYAARRPAVRQIVPVARRRAAFTLVELLVVIAIITVLAGLSLRVVVGMVEMGRESATKTTIQKISKALDTRLNEFQRKYGGNDRTTQERVKNTMAWHVAGQMTDGGSSVNYNQRLILARKLLFMQWFPQSASEVNSAMYPNIPATASNPEILYAVLGDDNYLTTEVRDPDGNGLNCFVDGWGEPIRFYRWPTRLLRLDDDGDGQDDTWPTLKYLSRLQIPNISEDRLRPDPNNPDAQNKNHPLLRDPMDPLRQCGNVDGFTAVFHQPATFWAPLIVSGGPDRQIGLLDPADGLGRLGELSDPWIDVAAYRAQYPYGSIPERGDSLNDNITSLNTRFGGK